MARDYASFELNLATGRTCRASATVEELLRELCGAEAALAVNSDAAATLLTLAALAAGREVIVSRGHMVDRGDGCRLPELMLASGARLREVGTVNNTDVSDYSRAIGETTAAILVVDPGNFTIDGAAQSATLEELVGVAQRRHRARGPRPGGRRDGRFPSLRPAGSTADRRQHQGRGRPRAV